MLVTFPVSYRSEWSQAVNILGPLFTKDDNYQESHSELLGIILTGSKNLSKLIKMAKKCFVICPIGDEGSVIRKHSDLTLKYIIEPVVTSFDYEVSRSDKMPRPGMISGQIVEMLIDSDLVIADLSGYNPNVFYELAIRHMTDLPVIQMISPPGTRIPFDIKDMRTISFDTDLECSERGRLELSQQMLEVNRGNQGIDNPIKQASNGKMLREWYDKHSSMGKENDINKVVLNEILGLRSILQRINIVRGQEESISFSDLDGSISKERMESLTQELADVDRSINTLNMESRKLYDEYVRLKDLRSSDSMMSVIMNKVSDNISRKEVLKMRRENLTSVISTAKKNLEKSGTLFDF